MTSIPYRVTFLDDESARVAAEVRLRRGGRLLNLDRMLLHCPPIAEGWGALMTRVRKGYTISPRHRELAICAIAKLTGAKYEFYYHVGRLLEAGMTQEQVAALDDVSAAACDDALFDSAERAVLRLLLESTRDIKISESAWAAVRASFPDPSQVLELMMIIASYNMVARVLVGLGVEIEGTEVAPVTGS
jgi:alkylhydroperoxidase family enzyme